MHWKTDDKQWIEERKIEWKRLNARFLIDKETLGFEDSEIQYIKRYFLYGERELNNYDWWRALPLYLQFAYHPSDSHDIWLSIWQEYLSVFDLEWDSHVLSSLNSSYKDIRKLDSFVALTKYDSCSENDIFCGRQFQLFDFFFSNPDFISSPWVKKLERTKQNCLRHLKNNALNIFDILDVKEQELRIYKTFGRRLLQTHVGFLDEDLFNRCIKGDQEREQSLKSLIESYRQVVLSKSKYPVEIQEISEEWVEQIESNKTSNSWTKLWQSVFE